MRCAIAKDGQILTRLGRFETDAIDNQIPAHASLVDGLSKRLVVVPISYDTVDPIRHGTLTTGDGPDIVTL